MAEVGPAGVVFHDAVEVRCSHNHASHIIGGNLSLEVGAVGHAIGFGNHLDGHAMIFSVGVYHAAHDRIDGGGNQHLVALLSRSHSHHHSLGGGCATVVH